VRPEVTVPIAICGLGVLVSRHGDEPRRERSPAGRSSLARVLRTLRVRETFEETRLCIEISGSYREQGASGETGMRQHLCKPQIKISGQNIINYDKLTQIRFIWLTGHTSSVKLRQPAAVKRPKLCRAMHGRALPGTARAGETGVKIS
jgi:hypothetical protein